MTRGPEQSRSRPTVTVVVLNWNGSGMLPTCLDAVAHLDYPGDRVRTVVVDNGSTDGSLELMRSRYPNVRVIAHGHNLGYAAANNDAVRGASTEYVAFLNNDARVNGRWLGALVDHLEAQPSVALAGSLVLDWRGESIDFAGSAMSMLGRGHQLGYGLPAGDAPRAPRRELFVNGAAMLVRRNVFLDAGGFDERFFAYYEDVDLGWRLWVLGWEVWLVPASIAYHRHHGTSRHVPSEKIELLLARNSLFTIIKNYGDDWLTRVLPIAILEVGEAIEGALLIDSRSLRISTGDPFAQRAPSPRVRKSVRGIAREFLDVATSRRRLVAAARSVRSRRRSGGRAGALAVAMSDVLAAWPTVLVERASIQSRRQRGDEAIIPLFRHADIPTGRHDIDSLTARALRSAVSEGQASNDA